MLLQTIFVLGIAATAVAAPVQNEDSLKRLPFPGPECDPGPCEITPTIQSKREALPPPFETESCPYAGPCDPVKRDTSVEVAAPVQDKRSPQPPTYMYSCPDAGGPCTRVGKRDLDAEVTALVKEKRSPLLPKYLLRVHLSVS